MRRATLQLVIAVVVLDVIALAIYRFADIAHTAPKIRVYFTVTWSVASALVAVTFLKKVRKARFSR
ncbi:MAG TPA: hypothetical protein VF929_11895 [Gemmatimonadaceae bacterium]